MTLTVTFHGCCRPTIERRKLETEFRDVMLEFLPEVNKIPEWQRKSHWRYLEAYWKAYWFATRDMTDKELARLAPIVRCE